MNTNPNAKKWVQDILYHFKSLDYTWFDDNDGMKLYNLKKYAKKKIKQYLKQDNHKFTALW